jgi:hypothetical protein
MKKKISVFTIALVVSSVLISTKVVTLSNENTIKSEDKTTKVDTSSQTKTNKGKNIAEANTTWEECLNSYLKEPDDEYYNPRQDLSKDHKVRVVKVEYTNGVMCKNGFYNYGLITNVFDEKTGELLTSAGHYTNSKDEFILMHK